MVQRINSGLSSATVSPFDPLAIARRANDGAAIVAPIAEGLQTLGARTKQIEDRSGRMRAQVEELRLSRELSGDLYDFSSSPDRPETGAGYSAGAQELWEAHVEQARGRLAGNPAALQAFEEGLPARREEFMATTEAQERDLGRDYTLDQADRSLDDAMQVASRQTFETGIPSEPSGFDWSEFVTGAAAGREDSVSGMVPGFRVPLARMLQALPEHLQGQVTIHSGYRSPELQRQLWERALERYGSPEAARRWVAPPGRSNHGHGNAADLTYGSDEAREWMHANAERFGLHFRMDWEPWHIEANDPGGVDENGIHVHPGETTDVRQNTVVSGLISEQRALIDAIPGINSAQRAELLRRAEGSIVQAAISQQGRSDPSGALAGLRSGQYDEVLSYSDDQRLQGSLIRDLERQITDQAQAQQRVDTQTARDVTSDFVAWNLSGQTGEAPVSPTQGQIALLTNAQRETLFEAQAIGGAVATVQRLAPENIPEYLESLRPSGQGFAMEQEVFDAAVGVARDRLERHAAEVQVDAGLSGGMVPNVDDAGVARVISDRFREHMAQNEAANDAGLPGAVGTIDAMLGFVEQYRHMPDEAATALGQMLSSDNEATRGQAIAAIHQLYDRDPALLANAPNGPAMDRAIDAHERMMQGFTMAEAWEQSGQMSDPSNQVRIDALRQTWRSGGSDLRDQVTASIGSRIAAHDTGAVMQPGAANELLTIVEDQFALNGGNVDAAVAVAVRNFYRTHAVTRVGGDPVWMRQAPEAHYRVFGDDRDGAWIDRQAQTFAADRLEGDVVRVTLAPVDLDRRDGQPEYRVLATMADGMVQDAGALFRPDVALAQDTYAETTGQSVEFYDAAAVARDVELSILDLRSQRDAMHAAAIEAARSLPRSEERFARLREMAEDLQAMDAQIREAEQRGVEAQRSMNELRRSPDVMGARAAEDAVPGQPGAAAFTGMVHRSDTDG